MNITFEDRRCEEENDYADLSSQYALWEELIVFVLQSEEAPNESEIAVSIVDDDEIAVLNEEYRSHEGATDVLSFPCDSIKDCIPGEALLLGDIIVSPSFSRKRALEYETTPEAELRLLLVHGTLHLLGYDHIEEDEAVEMEALEDSYLASFAASHNLPCAATSTLPRGDH